MKMLAPIGVLIALLQSPLSWSCDSLLWSQVATGRSVLSMRMPPAQLERVRMERGTKLQLKEVKLQCNGLWTDVEKLELHGNTTLYFERKSFSVSLPKKETLCESCKPLKDFMLISLTMDRNYFHNRLSFDLLNKLQIFHLDYHYTELVINETSQGIYLLMERPADWALKEAGSPFLIRRGYNGAIDKVKAAKGVSAADKKRYNRQFREIYQAIHQLKGEALVLQLDSLMDMDEYFVWLSFNFLISNGDYSDELYFYIDKDSGKFRIIPWDYDDILKREPHEGFSQRNQRIPPTSLLFSSEDRLDVSIANDPVLYQRYLIQMNRVLKLLSDSLVEETLDHIYEDLNPYLTSNEILTALRTDGYVTSVENLRMDLMDVNQYLRNQKRKIFNVLTE